ncbi:unnamed protein product [Calypogeia fissa]
MAEGAAATGSSNDAFHQWAKSITDALHKEIDRFTEPALKNSSRTIFRVRERTKESLQGRPGDMACYTPETISLGLFHRPRPGRVAAPQKGHNFKLQMAAAFVTSIHTHQQPHNQISGELRGSESRSEQLVDDVGEPTTRESAPGPDERLVERIRQFQNAGKSEYAWKELCHMVVGEADLQRAIDHYDLQDEDCIQNYEPREILQWAITLDAIVVGCLFSAYFCRANKSTFPFPLVRDCIDQQTVYNVVSVGDFIKLENQIPFFLLQKVLNIMCNGSDEAKTILNGACAKLAEDFACYFPGHDPRNDELLITQLRQEKAFLECDHLLDCVACVLRLPEQNAGQGTGEHGKSGSGNSWVGKFLSLVANGIGNIWDRISRATRGLNNERMPPGRGVQQQQVQTPEATATLATPKGFNIPSATVLDEAGIKVRGFSRINGPSLLPRFEQGWLRGTLYVPKLPILPTITWTLWRNVVAYECEKNREARNRETKGECNKTYHHRESQMHAFLAFMDCLVDTKDDVLLLTQGKTPVLPEGFTSKPEDLAERFNTILIGQPFVDYERWMLLADKINNYQKRRVRKIILESSRSYFGKPWLVISVLAAIGLFTLTFLQTYYAMLTYYP